MEIDQVKLSKTFKKYCSVQDLADFEKVSPATAVNGTMDGSKRDGTPIANGFLSPCLAKTFLLFWETKEYDQIRT